MARSLTTIQNSDRIVAIRGKESQRRNAAEAAALAWMAEAEGRGVAEAIAHMEQSVLQAPEPRVVLSSRRPSLYFISDYQYKI